MLFSEDLYGGSAFHLLFSANITGPLDVPGCAALARLTARHASLRTMFAREDDGTLRRQVPARWEPVVVEQPMPVLDNDPVAAVNALLRGAEKAHLRQFERPPVVFVLSRVAGRRAVLLLAHHAVVDGWSVGLVWRELAAEYARGDGGATGVRPAPSMEPVWRGRSMSGCGRPDGGVPAP